MHECVSPELRFGTRDLAAIFARTSQALGQDICKTSFCKHVQPWENLIDKIFDKNETMPQALLHPLWTENCAWSPASLLVSMSW